MPCYDLSDTEDRIRTAKKANMLCKLVQIAYEQGFALPEPFATYRRLHTKRDNAKRRFEAIGWNFEAQKIDRLRELDAAEAAEDRFIDGLKDFG